MHSASLELDDAGGYQEALVKLAREFEAQAAQQEDGVELKLDVTAVLCQRKGEEG